MTHTLPHSTEKKICPFLQTCPRWVNPDGPEPPGCRNREILGQARLQPGCLPVISPWKLPPQPMALCCESYLPSHQPSFILTLTPPHQLLRVSCLMLRITRAALLSQGRNFSVVCRRNLNWRTAVIVPKRRSSTRALIPSPPPSLLLSRFPPSLLPRRLHCLLPCKSLAKHSNSMVTPWIHPSAATSIMPLPLHFGTEPAYASPPRIKTRPVRRKVPSS